MALKDIAWLLSSTSHDWSFEHDGWVGASLAVGREIVGRERG